MDIEIFYICAYRTRHRCLIHHAHIHTVSWLFAMQEAADTNWPLPASFDQLYASLETHAWYWSQLFWWIPVGLSEHLQRWTCEDFQRHAWTIYWHTVCQKTTLGIGAISGMQFSSWLKQNSMLARFSPQRDSLGSFAQSASCSHLAKVEVTEYRLRISHISQRSGYINAAVAWCLLDEFSWMSYMLLTKKQKQSGVNDVKL